MKQFILILICIVFFVSCSKKLHLPNENLYLGVYALNPVYQDSTKWTPQTFKAIQEHVMFLDSLGKEGILLFAGRTKYNIGNIDLMGIMVLRYNHSIDSLRTFMSNDPSVRNNIQVQKFHPYSMGIQHFYNLEKSPK